VLLLSVTQCVLGQTAATFIYPANGQQNVNIATPFQWTPVSGALGYYLYVGTTPGGKDLVNTGVIQTTSYHVPNLPSSVPLYGAIWTEWGGGWLHSDVTFTAAQGAAAFIYPVAGQQNVSTATPFQWTPVSGALGYYLYVGTTPGARDLVDSGVIQATSYFAPPLPVGVALYARIYTEWNSGWLYNDITFTASGLPVRLLYPAQNAVVDPDHPFVWNEVESVQAYRLTIGFSPGSTEVFDSGGNLQQTSCTVPPLPVGGTLYARIWAEVDGSWSYSDTPFNAALKFAYPKTGSTDVVSGAFSWSPGSVLNGAAPKYALSVGTRRGAADLFSSETIANPSYDVPAFLLPAGNVLYARAQMWLGDGTFRVADTAFTMQGTQLAPAQIVYPANDETDVNVRNPFRWTATDLAQAYRLQVFINGSLAQDSGEISVPRYFAEGLPPGVYTAQLGTEVAGQWHWQQFSFTVVQNGYSMATEAATALWAVDYVRSMADSAGNAYVWTGLWEGTVNLGRYFPVCTDYRDALLQVLSEMNVAGRLPQNLQPQPVSITFLTNTFDTHTLATMWNSDSQSWMLLDPTFDLVPIRTADGGYATIQDMNTSALTQNWSAISYQFLGSYGDSIARAYYLDYPLLYLNIPPLPAPTAGNNPLPYLELLAGMPLVPATYYIQSDQNPLAVLLDGSLASLQCGAVDSLCQGAAVSRIALPAGSTAHIRVYQALRFVF
jgi:hypothetical protein